MARSFDEIVREKLLDRLTAHAASLEVKPVHQTAARYYNDPVGFAREAIEWPEGKGLTPYQAEVLAAIPVKKRVSVRGPHGLGKTALTAIAVLWFALTRQAAGRDWKCVTTAGAWRQLERYLWPEIHKWARMIKWDVLGCEPLDMRTELLTLNIKLRNGTAFAVASDNPELIEGAHADSVMYVFDESKAIAAGTFDAAEGAFSGAGEGSGNEAFAVAMSTPGEPSGRFYEIHRKAPGLDDWWVRHVTLDEAIAAGRVTREWAEKRLQQWTIASAVYHNRVLGEFYSSDEDGVIPLSWVEAANERWRAWVDAGRPKLEGRKTVGVDVARSGADKTVCAIRHGVTIVDIRHTFREDTMQTTGRVKGITENPEHQGILPVIDVIGIGAGVVDRLREQRIRVDAFNASEGTKRKDSIGELGFVNCLSGEARVVPNGRLLRIYRSRYEGPLLKVKMASGDEFTATPNHQVLTHRGWIAVQSLNVGDKLCDSSVREAANESAVGPEVDDVPPSLAEVYRAGHVLFGAERVERGAVDFHGDRPAGEVDVVTLDWNLLAADQSGGQRGQDVQLLRSLMRAGLMPGESAFAQSLRKGHRKPRVASSLPHNRVLGSAGLPLLKSQPVDNEVVSLRLGPGGDIVVVQESIDHVLADVECRSECVDGLPAEVALDDGGLVVDDGAVQALCFSGCSQRDAVIVEDPANHIAVDSVALAEGMQRFAASVVPDYRCDVDVLGDGEPDRLDPASWLDAVFAEDAVNGGPVGPVELAQRLERLAIAVPLDEVVGIELASQHGESFVYTLETTTGSYRTTTVVHRNCRSGAWWAMREWLDPSKGHDVALPPEDLLIGDLTAPHWKVKSGGKIQVESKDEIKLRLGRSTDDGDAVVMAFWPQETDWLKAFGVVHCEHCEQPFVAETHPDRCPHCRGPRTQPADDTDEPAEDSEAVGVG